MGYNEAEIRNLYRGNHMKRNAWFAVFAVFALLMITGCGKEPEPIPEPQPTVAPEPEPAQTVTETPLDSQVIDESALAGDDFSATSIEDLNRQEVLEDVYFEFDKSRLTPETREALKRHADWLKAHPTVKITIEGHCDERGTQQYNMALGMRRAYSVKNYLVSLGIEPTRMYATSYGEERPKVQGHDEWAWSQNRRAHFVITAK